MIPLSTLKNKHAGCPGAVLGGGSSLASDLAKLPRGTVLVSVNQHALLHCDAHYLVYLDRLRRFPALLDALDGYQGVIVSHQPKSDVDFDVEVWDAGFSASMATWLACFLGCAPVLLCGMDCYQDEPAPRFPLERQLMAWRGALTACPHAERICAVSGPLASIFGLWTPSPLSPQNRRTSARASSAT
jgi:hypothetical protein